VTSGRGVEVRLRRCLDDIAGCAKAAADAYAPLAERREDITHDALAGAVRCVIRLRDALIAGRRRGLELDEILRRVNSMLSLAASAEFPIVGVRHERIVATCRSLTLLAAELGTSREDTGGAAR
jgi:hypothetical protein